MNNLKGKVAVVTGGGRGIGASIANALAGEGASVCIASRNKDDIDKTISIIKKQGGKVMGEVIDIRNSNSIDDFAKKTLDTFGQVDILINNAGGWLGGNLIDVPAKDITTLIETNIIGTILTTKAFLPAMTARKTGHIVNIAFYGARHPIFPSTALYIAAKRGIEGFSTALSREIRPLGIKITTIFPESVASRADYDPLPDVLIKDGKISRVSLKDFNEAVLFVLTRAPHVAIEELVITSQFRKDFS